MHRRGGGEEGGYLAAQAVTGNLAPNGISSVSLSGYLDAETHTLLAEALAILLAAGHTRIVMDCRRLDFTDSRGIGDIIGCAKECRDAGGDLKFAGMRGLVRAVFEVLEMDKEFDLFETEEQAIAAFGAGPASGT